MPRAGQILFHKHFIYEDKTTGKKLVVALNTCGNDEFCLVAKTTSNNKHYRWAHPGCNSNKRCFCIEPECEQWFDIQTFVQLDNFYPVNVEILLNNKQISFVGNMTENCFAVFKRCLRKFKQDIPTGYWAQICQSS
jgi:hypothetical protein